MTKPTDICGSCGIKINPLYVYCDSCKPKMLKGCTIKDCHKFCDVPKNTKEYVPLCAKHLIKKKGVKQ